MLEIIYEDNDIILCYKQAGIATQTKRLGQQDMESLLKNYRTRKGEPPYIGIVHRLDQPVEGIMVFAKNQKSASALSKQVQNKMIGKYYYAVSACKPKSENGVLENYLITDKKINFTQVVEETIISKHCKHKNFNQNQDVENQGNLTKNAKLAKLEYHVADIKEEKVLFDIKLHTGRQHQIRVQMAHMGCPLIGDEKYGRKKALQSYKQLALCSYRLQFQHPTTKKQMDFQIFPKAEIFRDFEKAEGNDYIE